MDPITLAAIAQLRAADIIFVAGRLSTNPQFPEVDLAEIRRALSLIEAALVEFEAPSIEMQRAAQ